MNIIAFPVKVFDERTGHIREQHMGMSLRDYFAAKAMQAQLTTDGVPGEASDALLRAAAEAGQDPIDRLAHNSYDVADAMLRARSGS